MRRSRPELLSFAGLIISPDGTQSHTVELQGPAQDAARIGDGGGAGRCGPRPAKNSSTAGSDMLRVLVTGRNRAHRARRGGLQDMGFQPVVLPLTETVVLPVDAGLHSR